MEFSTSARPVIYWLSVSLLILVPLAFITAVYRVYVLPKFALLLIGSSALAPLILLDGVKARHRGHLKFLKSGPTLLVCAYFVAVSVSTLFGTAPLSSLFGSAYNQMGLITHFCFFICFVSLIVGINANETRLMQVLWAISLTGLLVALYALFQFFGIDPFVPSSMYTFDSMSGPQVRVCSTLGHSNYLGNFLLYTTPLSAGLVLATRGRAHYLALAALVLSIAAIGCSGTRGAWIGLVAGAVTFSAFELSGATSKLAQLKGGVTARRAILCLMIVAGLIGAVSLSPSSRTIIARVRSFTADGPSGSGRTLLWRDSIAIVAHLPVTGGGPESFRKLFLPYKSRELARSSPTTNNESSHNSYLDTAISYGLPGAALYIAIVASALLLLVGARRRATASSMKLIISGLVGSLVAVLVHNFFIYDQITTGLYFFAFIALARVVSDVISAGESAEALKGERKRSIGDQGHDTAIRDTARIETKPDHKNQRKQHSSAIDRTRGLKWGIGVAVCGFIVSLWYSVDLLQADMEIREVAASSHAGNFDAMVRHGERAVSSAEPTGVYNFLFISLLTESLSKAGAKSPAADKELGATRAKALELAVAYSSKPLAHTLTPELDNLLLAYLAWAAGDMDRTYLYASEVLRWDSNSSDGRWLMARALVARGDHDQAMHEAELALDLNPNSPEARSMLLQGRRGSQPLPQRIERLIEHGAAVAETGDIKGAQRIVLRALRLSNGKSPECHRALAILYERANSYNEAIREWQVFAQEQPTRAAAEHVQLHLDMLKGKGKQ